ncbi:MAG: PIN domain-containing protein [Anaerolineae bacterium]|nr:PIN domain-containing protein [Anaerolineae bacterium]MBL8106099.1 PIN domain-containing protein [Anaerolineales bacterium]MCC7190715.1 PIN domain-containing protein [Anaerolineales bacterium]
MAKPNIFLDSSALVAGAISSAGAARAILLLGEFGDIVITISELVVVESERVVARKSPRSLDDLRNLIKISRVKIVRNPLPKDSRSNLYLIKDPADVPILLVAMRAGVDFLVTHNRKHFLDDPKVAENSGLRIGTPGDALAWLRENL